MAGNNDDPVQGDMLKSLVQRIERIEEEESGLKDDKKEIYAEAKGNGYDPKIIRKVVQLRKRDLNERQEEEALLDLYLQAVGESADEPLIGTKPATRTAAAGKPTRPAPTGATRSLPGNEELAYQDVKAFVIAERNPSPSFLQKTFGIGFNRAGAYMDRLEAEGIVGPFRNGKREMLVKPVVTSQEAHAAGKLAQMGVTSMEFSGPGTDPVFQRVAEAARQAGIPVTVNPPAAPGADYDPFES